MYDASDVSEEIANNLTLIQAETGVGVDEAQLVDVEDMPDRQHHAFMLTFSDQRTFRVRVDELTVTATGHVIARP